MNIIYLNRGEIYEDIVDHHSYVLNLSSYEIKAWKKNSGLKGIRTHDLCDTGAPPFLYHKPTGSWLHYQFVTGAHNVYLVHNNFTTV